MLTAIAQQQRRDVLCVYDDQEWSVEAEGGMEAAEGEDDVDNNIKDLEFRLKSNVKQLQVHTHYCTARVGVLVS
jgi:hypothetical protein